MQLPDYWVEFLKKIFCYTNFEQPIW